MPLHAAQVKPAVIAELLARGGDLFLQHWAEAGPKHGRLAPNELAYRGLEQRGHLVVLIAEDDEGELVGYSVVTVAPGLHNWEEVIATSDLFFVQKAWRGSGTAAKLRRSTLQAARGLGASRMVWHARPDSRMESYLRASGCEVEEIVFSEVVA